MAARDWRADYQRDGFVFPLEAMSEAQAHACRRELEAIEAEHGQSPDFIYAINGGLNFILPLIDDLTARPQILDRVEELLGPNIIVFDAALFAKPARAPQYVGWHQDLTYWGLDGAEEVTAWIALSPATAQSGCMRMVPGSHRREIVAHRDTFHRDNLLTRGQEIAAGVDESEAVDVALAPGQFSLHHGRTFHGSHPNRSDDRRIGISVNYISTAMAMRSGMKPMVRLVRGEDTYGHFELLPPPRGILDPADVERLRAAKALGETYYYAGTDRRLATDAIGKAAS